MRHLLRAKEDVTERVGDRIITAKQGETIELSAAGAEIAMTLDKFDYLEEVPETEAEKARAKEAAQVEKERAKEDAKVEKTKAALEKTPKPKLVKKAARIGIENAGKMKKSELVETVLQATDEAAAGGEAIAAKSVEAQTGGAALNVAAASLKPTAAVPSRDTSAPTEAKKNS